MLRCLRCNGEKIEIEGIGYGIKQSEYVCRECGFIQVSGEKYFSSDDVYKGENPEIFSLSEVCDANPKEVCAWAKKAKKGQKLKDRWSGITLKRVK